MGLCYSKQEKDGLQSYADADWGSEADRKSTSGYLFVINENTVSWTTRRQTCVTLSSTEVEYVALTSAAAELLWEHRRLKHVDIKYHFVQDLVLKGILDVCYKNTKEQIADILTKPLLSEQFLKLRSKLGLDNVT